MTALLSSILILSTGLLAESKEIIAKPFVIIYTALGFIYAIMYGVIVIPSAYKFGVYNTRYILMIFIFILTIIPLILNSLNIDITSLIKFIIKMNRTIIYFNIIILILCIISFSFAITRKVINERETP